MCLQVHSLHHKSYNPTAFSGTNMHPVEATLYYTAALIPVSLGLHPVHALGNVLPLSISQCHQYSFVSCHRGLRHGSLAGARWVHVARKRGLLSHVDMTNDCIKCLICFRLHHKHFDCNYGAMHVPLDWLLGTYAGSKEEVMMIEILFIEII